MCTNLGTDIQRVHAGDELAEESIQFRSLNESVGYSEKKKLLGFMRIVNKGFKMEGGKKDLYSR